jgi:hypothetical protein
MLIEQFAFEISAVLIADECTHGLTKSRVSTS